MADFTGSLLTGASIDLDMPRPTTDRHIQVDAGDTGTLTVFTKVTGKATFTQQATITQGAIIIDMIDVQELQLSAASGGVDYTVSAYGH